MLSTDRDSLSLNSHNYGVCARTASAQSDYRIDFSKLEKSRRLAQSLEYTAKRFDNDHAVLLDLERM